MPRQSLSANTRTRSRLSALPRPNEIDPGPTQPLLVGYTTGAGNTITLSTLIDIDGFSVAPAVGDLCVIVFMGNRATNSLTAPPGFTSTYIGAGTAQHYMYCLTGILTSTADFDVVNLFSTKGWSMCVYRNAAVGSINVGQFGVTPGWIGDEATDNQHTFPEFTHSPGLGFWWVSLYDNIGVGWSGLPSFSKTFTILRNVVDDFAVPVATTGAGGNSTPDASTVTATSNTFNFTSNHYGLFVKVDYAA